ncbi:hypothetical protein [Sessilibacter sp. MAH4]
MIKLGNKVFWMYVVGTIPVLFIGILLWLENSVVQLDENYCAVDNSYNHISVIVDKSDKWGDSNISSIRRLLSDIYTDVETGDRFTISSITGFERQTTVVNKLFDKCNPGSKKDCNGLIENCTYVQRDYEQLFSSKLEEIIEELKQPGTSSYSPLIETLSESVYGTKSSNLTIHFISDFLENGKVLHFYEEIPLSEKISEYYPLDHHGSVNFHGYILDRYRHEAPLRKVIIDRWGEYLHSQNVQYNFTHFIYSD